MGDRQAKRLGRGQGWGSTGSGLFHGPEGLQEATAISAAASEVDQKTAEAGSR